MIAVNATFAVLKRQPSPTVIKVVTILAGLADIRPHDAIAPEWSLNDSTDRSLCIDALKSAINSPKKMP
jgi:hypothetical protein